MPKRIFCAAIFVTILTAIYGQVSESSGSVGIQPVLSHSGQQASEVPGTSDAPQTSQTPGTSQTLQMTQAPPMTQAPSISQEAVQTTEIPDPELVDDGFILVDGGRFTLGSHISEPGRNNDEPAHEVSVESFWISLYEVTQKEWESVMGTNIQQQRDMMNHNLPLRGEGNSYPMYYINWFEALEYCNRLSMQAGLQPVYRISGGNVTVNWESNGYRLPTEAEWEYAARGGQVGQYFTGIYAGSNNLDHVGWYNRNSEGQTHPVGQKIANPVGLYDMSGNVWEWCWDWYGEYSTEEQTDLRGPSEGFNRVIRGGSWDTYPLSSRVASRSNYSPASRSQRLGLRLVRNN